jgi:HAD superfamily hydrolase (TIGR01662 family)
MPTVSAPADAPDGGVATHDRDGVPVTIVVATLGRRSLSRLLEVLTGELPKGLVSVLVVDDRRTGTVPIRIPDNLQARVLSSGGRGPAAARNVGWRVSRTPWVVFLDDDVVPTAGWFTTLQHDLFEAAADVVAIQGRIVVPLPGDRRPTDWERNTAGLETARWITADLAVRREALSRAGGFDERFRRAYREDADLALRLRENGGRLVRGTRLTAHPVRAAGPWVSLRAQAGNADDQLMRRLHGRDWRARAQAPRGCLHRHAAVVITASATVVAGLTRRRRIAITTGASTMLGIAQLTVSRIGPGPRTGREVGRMLMTSPLLPFAAVAHSVRGRWLHRNARSWTGVPELVLFDRDGTLIEDLPYNGDPDRVRAIPGAADALASLRTAGIRVGVITNQSGVGRGLITEDDARRVNDRTAQLLGPFDVVAMCCHTPENRCECRKPQPGLVHRACEVVRIPPNRTAVIGDIESDVEAAERAGALGVLVPNERTDAREVDRARRRAGDLAAAVRMLLDGSTPRDRTNHRAEQEGS